MGLLDKRAADWTARDVVNAWTLTGILDLFKILLVLPFFFRRKRTHRTAEEILQAQKDTYRDFFP